MTDMLTIPTPKNVPKPESEPAYRKKTPNFADDEHKETIDKVLAWAQDYLENFKTQSAREKFEDDMDIADELTRASLTASQLKADTGAEHDATKTDLPSATYYRFIRTLTAWENSVMVGSGQTLPVVCDPMYGLPDTSEDLARQLSDYRNIELEYTFEQARLRGKICDWNFYANKYGNILIEAFWNHKREKRMIRQRKTSVGALVKQFLTRKRELEWVEKNVTVCDWPDFEMHDIRRSWFDAEIDDMQQQSCIITCKPMQLSDIYAMQAQGAWSNLEKLTTEHQSDMDESDDVLDDRKTNAGESGTGTKVTKLFDVYTVWIRVPVDTEKGKWDTAKNIQQWFRCVFIGDLSGKTALCALLEPNPYANKKNPFLLYNIRRDDKGAFHMGHVDVSKANIQLEMTLWNMCGDNVRNRNRKPWIIERGSINLRDKVFTAAGNRVWPKKPGAADPKEVEIQDTLAATLPMIKENEAKIQDIFGVNNSFLAEAYGGRTSATEAQFTTEQAVKVATEDLSYRAEILFPYMVEWILCMMDQFSDPATVLVLAREPKPVELKPSNVWGPINIRVTAIKQFQDSILRRKEENQFINQIFPLMQKVMSPKGQVNFFTQVAKNRGFENVDEWFEQEPEFDAKHVARSENQQIMFEGVYDLPKPEENHVAHLAEHEPFLATYILLPKEQQDERAVTRMKLHVQQHNNFAEQAAQPKPTAAPMPQGGGEMTMAGQETGAMMAAPEGAAENMCQPATEGGA